MTKWSQGQDEVLPITHKIINVLKDKAAKLPSDSMEGCIFDAIYIGLQTGSCCRKYCRGNSTNSSNRFCKVPLTYYAGNFAGYLLAFVAEDFTFLSASLHFIPAKQAQKQAAFIHICFRFDKGGTGNIQFCTFKRFQQERQAFCPLLAAVQALQRWENQHLDPLTLLFCYSHLKTTISLQDTIVTKLLHQATIEAYPAANNHLYCTRLKDVWTHSLRVTACLIFSTAKLSDSTIEHRLRWALTAWKVYYVCESLSHISQACASAFFTALEDSLQNNNETSHQVFDMDGML